MIAVDWRSFVPLVQLATARCPIPVIVDKIREAAREFCRRSRVWTLRSLAADLLAGEGVYGLRPPDQTAICGVLWVRVNGRTLTCLTPEQWQARPEASAREPEVYRVTEPAMVHVLPVPDADVPGALTVEAVLCPSVGSQRGPEFLLTSYGQAIAAGAQARLMLIPDRPWTDVAGSVVFDAKFEDGIAGARIKVNQGGGNADTRVRPRRFC